MRHPSVAGRTRPEAMVACESQRETKVTSLSAPNRATVFSRRLLLYGALSVEAAQRGAPLYTAFDRRGS